jgi:hypothetical protein
MFLRKLPRFLRSQGKAILRPVRNAPKLRLSLTMLLVKMHLRKILPGANQKASQKKHLRIGT